MAVNLMALNAFRTASGWTDGTMLSMNGEGAVQQGGAYGGFLSAKGRTVDEKNANNAVRTELLKALAQTFDIATDRMHNGTRFSQDFMRKLEKLLGPAFKRDDFKVGEDGVVASGRPLTARRIKAIIRSAQDAADIERHNESIMVKLRTNVMELPEEFMDVVANAYHVVKDRFGGAGVPSFDELHKLVDGLYVGRIFGKVGTKRVTPEALRDLYRKYAIEQGALRLATGKTRQIISAHGGGGDANIVFKHVNKRHPEILRAILKAKTPAAAEAAFDRFAQVVEADYARFQICNREVREFNFKVQNSLAQRLGVPVQSLVGIMDQHAVKRYGEKLMDDILGGKNPADGENAIKAAFENCAAGFAAGYADALASIDGLDVPVSAKDRMKMHVLSYNNVSYLNFDTIFQIGANLQAGPLKEQLDANAPKEDIYNAMVPITRMLDTAVNEMFDAARAAGKDIGADELSNVSKLVLEVFFGRNPGLRDQVAAFLKRPEVLADDIHAAGRPAYSAFYFEPVVRDAEGNDVPTAKEHVLANLGKPQLNPIYAQALISAARELGRQEPIGEILALFGEGRNEGDTLRAALRQFEGELDTATLKAFAIGVLQRAE